MVLRSRLLLLVSVASFASVTALNSEAKADEIKDQSGSSFMEEVQTHPPSKEETIYGTQPSNTLRQRTDSESSQLDSATKQGAIGTPSTNANSLQDLSNVGIARDRDGNIIPTIVRDGQMPPAGTGGIQAYNEVPALTAPQSFNGTIGGLGATFIPVGPMTSVPNPYYQQPNVNLRVGPMNFNNAPYPYGYAPPARVMIPIAPNGSTSYSTPFSSGTVTNTTRVFGPSTTPPPTLPDQ